jgi:hypothetical protein
MVLHPYERIFTERGKATMLFQKQYGIATSTTTPQGSSHAERDTLCV